MDRRLVQWIAGWVGSSLSRQIVAAYLALTCADSFAQKAKPILESAGHRVVFPFLDDAMVRLALALIPQWRMDEPNASLKRALSRRVPRNMVYGAKSAFLDPKNEVFFTPEFIGHLRAAADPASPIAGQLIKQPLLTACDLLKRKKQLLA